MSTLETNMPGAFSFEPQEKFLKDLSRIGIHYREREKLRGGQKQTIVFWDTAGLDLLHGKKLLYQKDGVFHFSEEISFEFGDILSKKRAKDVLVAKNLDLKGMFTSNEQIKDYLLKGRGNVINGFRLRPVETYVVESLVEVVIENVLGKELEHPFHAKIFSGQNSKKSQKQNRLYNINFGVGVTQSLQMGEAFEKIKEVFGSSMHSVRHPFVTEMIVAGRLSL